MDSSGKSHEQQLTMLQQHSELYLQKYLAQSREDLQRFAGEKIAEIQETIRQNNEQALTRFNQALAALAQKRRDNKIPLVLLQSQEDHLRAVLNLTIDSNRTLLETFIVSVQCIIA